MTKDNELRDVQQNSKEKVGTIKDKETPILTVNIML